MNTHTPHARVPVAIACNATVSPQARCLFLILACYAGPDGSCWPSRRTLAANLGFSIRSVATLLSELEASGLLRREARLGRSTIFHLQLAVGTNERSPAPPASDCTGDSGSDSNRGRGLHGSEEADCTGTGSTREADCTPVALTCELDCTGTGSTREAGCTGVGSIVHGGGKQPSSRTIPLNYPIQPLSEREAGPAPDEMLPEPSAEPIPDPPEIDLSSSRRQYDTTHAWPTLEQAQSYARRFGIPDADTCSIWESYTAVGWVDRHGSPIRHWGAALSYAWRYRQENRSRFGSALSHPFTPSIHRTHERQRSYPAGGDGGVADADINEDPRVVEALALYRARRQRTKTEGVLTH